MTKTLGDLALAVSASLELSIVVKATLTLAIGLLTVRAGRRARAARRYLVLAATFGVLVLLPFTALVAPPVGISIRTSSVLSVPDSFASPTIEGPAAATVSPASQVTPSRVVRSTAQEWTMPSLAAALRTAWMIGFGLCLMPVVFTLWQLRTLQRSALQWAKGEALARRLSADAGVRRTVTVARHPRVGAPLTTGLFAPVILLPTDAAEWSDDDLERALVHELEHVRRMDWPAHLLARTTCAIYWFHPLAWRAWRLFHLDADRACDDAVLARGEAGPFAEQLVTMAQRISSASVRPILAMAGNGDLSQRVRAALDPRQARGRAGVRWTAAAAVIGLAVVALLTPLSAVEHKQSIARADRRLSLAPPAALELAPVIAIRAVERPKRAQGGAPALQGDRFETISITQSPETAGSGGIPSPAGTSFIADNVSLVQLVSWAHGIGHGKPSAVSRVARPGATIEGLPSWNDRFDVRAKAPQPASDPPPATLGPIHQMVQWLLADRFQLATHWQPSGRPVYVLTQAPGGPGPQLRASTAECASRDGWMIWITPGGSPLLELLQRPVTLERPRCGVNQSLGSDGMKSVDGARYIGIGAGPLQALTDVLERDLEQPVVDRTGLAGNFDIELRYTRHLPGIRPRTDSSTPPVPLAEVPVSPEWPVLADALRDQLGIQLTIETVDTESLVIDRVARPVLD
jgi:uncharacterized protein (TIGR03435 family)